jgi:hypothetical protein
MSKRQARKPDPYGTPDLHTQFEALLDTVWRCEEMADLEERVENRIRFEAQREKHSRWREHR